MPEEEKERFKALASLDKIRYQKEVDYYKKATDVKVEKRGRKKRQPGHPKRNMWENKSVLNFQVLFASL